MSRFIEKESRASNRGRRNFIRLHEDGRSAKIQPVVGSMKLGRLRDIAKAYEITLTREEWYELIVRLEIHYHKT
ncbi:hypothetical protein ACOI1C_18930 [Bacillus sp. DJP31]|uniref:hypothetical protein n=1 Tax=Bacillus sp. DJP31 TaxID=3409789 RepID=UPI003BB58F0F